MYWVAIIFAVVAAAFFINGIWIIWNGSRSLSWPSAKGVIRSSRVEERSLMASTNDTGLRESAYDALVRYEFTVGGRLISGYRISFMPLGASLRDVKEIAGRYRVGKQVKVYHHPAKPNLCTLERGTTTFAWVVLCAAALILTFLLGIPAGFVKFTPAG